MVSHTHIPMGQLYPFGVGLYLLFQPGSPEPQRSSELKFLRLLYTRSFQELMDTTVNTMKTSKIIGMAFLAFFLCLNFSSCSKDDPVNENIPNKNEQVTPAPTISISTSDITISSDGGNESISFKSSDKWTATANVDWITLSATNGNSGDATITATIKANDTYDQRNGSITLKTGSVSKDITVTQMQSDAIIIAQKEYKIDFEAQTLDFEIQNNVDFSVELSVSWIKQLSSRGLASSKLFFDIEENTSGDIREGKITFTSGNIKETVVVTQESKINDDTANEHDYVDLGITDENGNKVLWATTNLGAENPWEYGNYYAWGETKAYGEEDTSNVHNYAYGNSYKKTNCSWNTYKWATGTDWYSISKYSVADGDTKCWWYEGSNYVGIDGVKNQSKLDAEDDAATANWGTCWRMPTSSELQALVTNCNWKWVEEYKGHAVNGYVVYKAKSNADKGKFNYSKEEYSLADIHIFLPASGCIIDFAGAYLHAKGSGGGCWSSELYNGHSRYAERLSFGSSGGDVSIDDRIDGNCVRPVFVP